MCYQHPVATMETALATVISCLLLAVCSAALKFESSTTSLALCPGQPLTFSCSSERQDVLNIFLSLVNSTSGTFLFVASVAFQGNTRRFVQGADTRLGQAVLDHPGSLTYFDKGLMVDIPFRREFEGLYRCKAKYLDQSYETRDIPVTCMSDCCGGDGGVVKTTQPGKTTPTTNSAPADLPPRDVTSQNWRQALGDYNSAPRMSQSSHLVGLAAILVLFLNSRH